MHTSVLLLSIADYLLLSWSLYFSVIHKKEFIERAIPEVLAC
jgi:hypothetical protein